MTNPVIFEGFPLFIKKPNVVSVENRLIIGKLSENSQKYTKIYLNILF